jgi:succinate-semialdehyde dehydrogenase/glutarate-semialdehyde dehydrogenase
MTEGTVLDKVEKRLFVGGEWREATGGGTLPVEDPSTAEVICEVADATPEDAMAALGAACETQGDWAGHPPRERGEILRRAYEMTAERAVGTSAVVAVRFFDRPSCLPAT